MMAVLIACEGESGGLSEHTMPTNVHSHKLAGGYGPEKDAQHLLVSRSLDGDPQAFRAIVDQYGAWMLRTAMLIVKDRDIAEDAVQDALILAWRHLGDLHEPSALRAWLTRIVINQCISFKRRVTRTAMLYQTLLEQENMFTIHSVDEYSKHVERDWELTRAIEALPIRQRVAIVLHYYNGMTLTQMSQMLQISENTLKKRVQAALANLRRVLRAVEADGGMSPKASSREPNL